MLNCRKLQTGTAVAAVAIYRLLNASSYQDCLLARRGTKSRTNDEKNFAATFPAVDLMFGTFYMPAGKLPDRYGIADREFPTTFGAQFVHSFIK